MVKTTTRMDGTRLKYVVPVWSSGDRTQPGFVDEQDAIAHAEANDDRVRRKQTLRAWLRYYNQHLAPPAGTTMGRHVRRHLTVLVEMIDETKLYVVDSNDIAKLYKKLLERPRTGPTTAHGYLDTIQTCFDVAVDQGRLASNPVKKWRENPNNRLKKAFRKPDLPDRKKYSQIKEYLPDYALAAFGLIDEVMMSGLEISGLRIFDVREDCLSVTVSHTFDANFGDVRSTLPNKERPSFRLTVALSKQIKKAIAFARSIGSDYVINPLKPDGQPYSRTMVRRQLTKDIKLAQLAADVVSRKTGLPHRLKDFADSGVVTRLNSENANIVAIGARAGYAGNDQFSKRFGGSIRSETEHLDMDRAYRVNAMLHSLQFPQP